MSAEDYGCFEAFGEDGETVWIDADTGEPVAAVDAYGDELDPSAFEFVADEPDPVDELRAQVDDLAARLDEPRPPLTYEPAPPEPPPLPERPGVTPEALVEHWHHEVGRLETIFGRTLLDRERAQLANHALAAGHGDLVRAARELAEQGQPLRDLDDGHEARVGHAVERLQEMSGEGPDPLTGEPERRQEVYDVSRHEDRVAAMLDGMAGHDLTGATYDSTTVTETGGEP